jgi:hypothetical protein
VAGFVQRFMLSWSQRRKMAIMLFPEGYDTKVKEHDTPFTSQIRADK